MVNTLNKNGIMKIDDSLVSTNGLAKLSLQNDGTLVLYNSDDLVWTLNFKTSSNNLSPNVYLTVDNNGNIVIFDNTVKLYTIGNNDKLITDASLILNDDGSLILVNIFNNGNKQIMFRIGRRLSSLNIDGLMTDYDTLLKDQSLMINDSIISPSGNYTLKFETDSKLVIYDNSGNTTWTSGIFGVPNISNTNIKINSFGNLVYILNSREVWSVGNSRSLIKNAFLNLDDNGVLKLINIDNENKSWEVWSSNYTSFHDEQVKGLEVVNNKIISASASTEDLVNKINKSIEFNSYFTDNQNNTYTNSNDNNNSNYIIFLLIGILLIFLLLHFYKI